MLGIVPWGLPSTYLSFYSRVLHLILAPLFGAFVSSAFSLIGLCLSLSLKTSGPQPWVKLRCFLPVSDEQGLGRLSCVLVSLGKKRYVHSSKCPEINCHDLGTKPISNHVYLHLHLYSQGKESPKVSASFICDAPLRLIQSSEIQGVKSFSYPH